MILFSADATGFSKKTFDPENMKKCHQKLLKIGLQTFFYVVAWLPKQPNNRNPVPPKAGLGIQTGEITFIQIVQFVAKKMNVCIVKK